MEFCEYCGSILNEDGRCPWEECPHNVELDILKDIDNEEQ